MDNYIPVGVYTKNKANNNIKVLYFLDYIVKYNLIYNSAFSYKIIN